MIHQLISTLTSGAKSVTGGESSPIAKFQGAYADWCFDSDMAAIMASLDRLSDRQLTLIGMHRDDLFEAVSDLIVRAEEQRSLGMEVAAMLADDVEGTAPAEKVTPAETEGESDADQKAA